VTLDHPILRLSRARGCLLGQLAGDALGGLVEFQSPDKILRAYPDGVRLLHDGGHWGTIAGQPTDDSEMALMLARSLVEHGSFNPVAVKESYLYWLNSRPFDCGNTVTSALKGHPKPDSQANGAMMRTSPLGIFGAGHDLKQVAEWASQDAAITHPHSVCRQANALYAMAIADAIQDGTEPQLLYRHILDWAREMKVDPTLLTAIKNAQYAPPDDFMNNMGWVLIAFQNALYQLLHAPGLEEGVVNTIMRGGDTDTNAAICGALLGAVYGVEAVPQQWRDAVLSCRPEAGIPGVNHPRPECFWPVDAMELAEQLLHKRAADQ